MSDSTNNSIYTEEEFAKLSKIEKVRFAIIDEMTKDGVPDNVGKLRVLNEVMSAADKKITDSAIIRVKNDEAANAGAMAASMAELLKQARAKRANCDGAGGIPEIAKEHANVDLVDGEVDINPEPLSPEEFVAPRFDPTQLKD